MPSESNGHIDLDHEFRELIHHQDQTAEAIARRLDPARPRVVSAAPEQIGAIAVSARMQALLKQAQELHKVADILATALAGPAQTAQLNKVQQPRRPDHLFGRQMVGLDEVSLMLDSVRQAIERAARSLT
jgi:hypothetical protein